MAYNGAGTYSLPVNSFNPAVATTDISPTDWNSTGSDLSTALSTAICKDGQTVTTASVPFVAGATFGSGLSAFDSAGVLSLPNAVGSFRVGTGTATCSARFLSNDPFPIRFFNGTFAGGVQGILGINTPGDSIQFSAGAGSALALISLTTGAYSAVSDADKKVVGAQSDYTGAIKALFVGDFTWKEDGKRGFGVLAQQANEVLGGLGVKPGTDGDPWTVEPAVFGYLALWAAKKLLMENDALKTRVEALEAAA